MIDKKEFLSSYKDNERKINTKERKEFIQKISKPIVAALLSTMLSSSFAEDIDISKLSKYASLDCKKYGIIKICIGKNTGDWDSHYNTNYYEKYNKEVPYIDDTRLRGIEYLKIANGVLYLMGYKYNLVSVSNVIPDEDFLKRYDLDEVVISIRGVSFKARPKFVRFNFSREGKKGIFGYHMEKSLTLVYVPYLDKIRVLGVIDDVAGFIETQPKDYEVVGKLKLKKGLYYKISQLLDCEGKCRYKKDLSGDIYFYSGNKLVGMIQDMGDKKFVLKNGVVIGKIIEGKGKILLLDKNNRVLYRYTGLNTTEIKIPEIRAIIRLQLNN